MYISIILDCYYSVIMITKLYFLADCTYINSIVHVFFFFFNFSHRNAFENIFYLYNHIGNQVAICHKYKINLRYQHSYKYYFPLCFELLKTIRYDTVLM